MIFFESPTTDPYFNLALEEYMFENIKDETVFLLWQNSNTIVIGKYQNPAEEIDQHYVDAHQIRVARRLSGGGAVYHDKGNLNYTIITDVSENPNFDFALFVQPVVKALAEFGITAEFNGRNDVTIEGKKFSGNSQYYRKNRVLHHGCIMLDSNLETVANALKVKPAKFESKSVKSVRSRVTCINDHASSPIQMEDFKNTLAKHLTAHSEKTAFSLTDDILTDILSLRDQKYATWEWNYGHTPPYNVRVEKKFPAGIISAYLQTQNSRITSIQFFGDFFCKKDLHELERKLVGLRLDSSLLNILNGMHIEEYIHMITAENLYELIDSLTHFSSFLGVLRGIPLCSQSVPGRRLVADCDLFSKTAHKGSAC